MDNGMTIETEYTNEYYEFRDGLSYNRMYYFDESNLYHRNTGWYIYTILNLICILASSVMSIRYRRAVSKTMLTALLLYAFAPVIAIVLQVFIYGISITNIGILSTNGKNC